MQKLLRQIPSGHLFVWTPQLAERSDMEPYEPKPAPSETAVENTSENPSKTSAEVKPADALEGAKAAFRRQVSKSGRKSSARTSGGP